MLRKINWSSSIKSFIVTLLFFFYLSSSYVSAVHIHHDGEDHSDTCEVCVIVKNFHNANMPDIAIVIPFLEYTFNEKKYHHLSSVTPVCKGFCSTAPPLHYSIT